MSTQRMSSCKCNCVQRFFSLMRSLGKPHHGYLSTYPTDPLSTVPRIATPTPLLKLFDISLVIHSKSIDSYVRQSFPPHSILLPFTMSSDVTFGPPGQEWSYSKTAKTYDLSGESANKISIATTEGPEETSISLDPGASALVIVDMQNFFLDAQCMNHPNGLKAVEPTIKVIEKCRELGIQVNSLLFPASHLTQNEPDPG
jgi:hypothetical protein